MLNNTNALATGTRVLMNDGSGEATVKVEYYDDQNRPRYTVYQGRRRDHGFVAGMHFTVIG